VALVARKETRATIVGFILTIFFRAIQSPARQNPKYEEFEILLGIRHYLNAYIYARHRCVQQQHAIERPN